MGLADIRFRWGPLILVGFLAQIVLFSDPVAERVGDAGPLLYVASTLLVGAAVLRNLDLPGMPIIVLGAISNMAAILANGGFMPADPGALAAVGMSAPTVYSNSAVVAAPALEPLIDRFALPRWLPMANVFSIGDVLLAVGLVVLDRGVHASSGRDAGAARWRRPRGRLSRPVPNRNSLSRLGRTRTVFAMFGGGPTGHRRELRDERSLHSVHRPGQTRREAGTQSQGSPLTRRPPGCRGLDDHRQTQRSRM